MHELEMRTIKSMNCGARDDYRVFVPPRRTRMQKYVGERKHSPTSLNISLLIGLGR